VAFAIATMDTDAASLAGRAEIQSAHRSLKMVRAVCKEYKLGFHMPDGIFNSDDALKQGTRAVSNGADSEDEGSSDSDFSSEDDKQSLGHHAQWADVKDMLDKISPAQRVKHLKDVNKSMAECSKTARRQLAELDTLEADSRFDEHVYFKSGYTSEGEASPSSPRSPRKHQNDGDPSSPLLDFSPAKMPVAQAVKRCIEVIPHLRQHSLKIIKAREEAKAEEQRIKEELERETAEAGEETEARKDGLPREIAKKLHSYGTLPLSADPDLQKIVEVQRKEIHALVASIVALENQEKMKKLAQKCIEGITDVDTDDQDLLIAAQNHAQELKVNLLAERRREAEQKYREERADVQVPTDEEIKASQDEFERLREEVDTQTERIKRLMELERDQFLQAARDAELESAEGTEDVDSTEAGRRAKVQGIPGMVQRMPQLGFAIEDASEVHKKLTAQYQALENQIQKEDKRIEQAEGVIKNVEHTLKTLEETKTIFFEHIAHERPALLTQLIELDSEGDSEENDEDMYGSHSLEETLEDGEEQEDPMLQLAAEERWLRTQLRESQENLSDVLEGCISPHGEWIDKVGDSQDWNNEPLVTDIQRLVEKIEAKCSGRPMEDSDDEGEKEMTADNFGITQDSGMTKEDALEQLRSMPHTHLKALVQVQYDNESLIKQIRQEQVDIQKIRLGLGNPDEILKPGSAIRPPPGVSPELLIEVRRKCRELNALRKKWWSDRQDPTTTVRRALAVAEMPESPGDEDVPPASEVSSLFERIHSSMTAP